MAGNPKYAKKISKKFGLPIDASCVVSRPGTTIATAVTLGVGGGAGAAIATSASQKGAEVAGDHKLPPNMALALGPEAFYLVKLSVLTAGPKQVVREIPYTDIRDVEISEKKITSLATISFSDGSSIGLESKRLGTQKRNIEVLEELRNRCS